MDKFVTFSVNQNYFNYAKNLSKSIIEKTNCLVVCRCVNCSDESMDELEKLGVYVLEDKIKLSNEKRLKNPSETPILNNGVYNRNQLCSDEIAYTCHSRFSNIDHIFEIFKDSTVFAIDADFVVLSDFSEVFSMVEELSMMDKENCVHEDAICIRNTSNSRKFIKDVIKKIKENEFFWDQDTEALKYAFEKNKDISFKELDIKFKDYKLRDDSLLWSGDAESKFNPKFVKKLCH